MNLTVFGLALAMTAGTVHAQAQTTTTKKKAAAPAKKAVVIAVPPTEANVKYGDHERQVIDFFKAKSDTPTPLILFIHGGGWSGGDKTGVQTSVQIKRALDEGVSVAAINYRYIQQAQEEGIVPPVKGPLQDAARALQFIRSKAKEWNIDKTRIGATGGSAGACTSLWLALHDDMADPKSDDPIARESTRLACVALSGPQTTLDPKQIREWMPNGNYGGHAFGFRKAGQQRGEEFRLLMENRDSVMKYIKEYSPIELVSKDDPPIYMTFGSQNKPPVKGEEQADPTHSALYGVMLGEKLEPLGVEYLVTYPGHTDPRYKNVTDFLLERLKAKP
jgi:acetyl esterase/lipase